MAQVVKLSKGTIEVEIGAAKVDFDFSDKLIQFPRPEVGGRKDTNAPDLILPDVRFVTNQITVTGYLLSDSTSSALHKKQALISYKTLTNSDNPLMPASGSLGILFTSGYITLTWRGETYTVKPSSVKITDEARRKDRAGYCSDSQYTTQASCESAGETWFPAGVDKYKIVFTALVKGET